MELPKRYDPSTIEPQLQAQWQEAGIYHFSPEANGTVYAIDTPPPTVSGHLHLGNVYSYSHTDFMARFWRMNGANVFYPMGYDDNGLPTERLVERMLGITATQVGRRAFIAKCLEVSEAAERDYEALWQRLGLSIDWRYTYRTIDALARRTSQFSFLDLYQRGLAYRQEALAIWCPECRTAIAQAELNDLERESEFVTLAFPVARLTAEAAALPIATTRPELLPACVAVFVHPDDARFRDFVGQRVTVPLFGQEVPILADPAADPEKGTGAVMCCTFGDTTDVEWWRTHSLPLRVIIGRDGRLTADAGDFAGLPMGEARRRIVAALEAQGFLLGQQPLTQSVRVHERCDTPVEYIVTPQWFIRVLDFKEALIEAGEQVIWHPAHMQARYREWVENLRWDWCISRQRYFGVPFPVWYCDACGAVVLADATQLPVDPADQQPAGPCACGGTSFTPEADVMDTWATSSLTPQIAGRWLTDERLYEQVFPMALRPQAHEIIRTWAFDTIVKSYYHFGAVPWKEVAVSGWGLAPDGARKISKSRGGGPMAPLAMIERYSADAVRYWAASTGFGKDATISEEKIQLGARLVNKLWNVARFSQRFLDGYTQPHTRPALSPTDRWILSQSQRLIARVTALFHDYEYAAAKSESETFFWRDLADNYLEMAKLRLYDEASAGREGARYALHHVLLTLVQLFAPFLPYVTEAIYQALFASAEGSLHGKVTDADGEHRAVPWPFRARIRESQARIREGQGSIIADQARITEGQTRIETFAGKDSIHRASWPVADETLVDIAAEAAGEALVAVATAVRRYKSERNLSVGTDLQRLQLATADLALAAMLREAEADIKSITRARHLVIGTSLDPELEMIEADGAIAVVLAR
jgi:valyl-tRNA synthetase